MTDCSQSLVLAALGMDEVLKIIVMVVFGVIYLVNHLLGSAKAQKRRPARPGGRPETQDEVAEFLKRATEKRAPAKRTGGRPAAPRQPIPAQIVEPDLETPPSDRWPRSVYSQVGNSELAQRAAHLGHVDQMEAAFQSHIQAFGHSVGRIQESAADVTPPPHTRTDGDPQPETTPAGEIFASLTADAQSLRKAIILNEIIRRPEERW